MQRYRNWHLAFFFAVFCVSLSSLHAQTCEEEFPLRASGRFLIRPCGKRFRLKSVNWFGASDVREVVGGLDKQPLASIVHLIDKMGFNSVRLPFSNQMLHRQTAVDAKFLAANPLLLGKIPIEVYDAVVEALTSVGIAVILNNHTTTSKWCCGYDENGLWFHDRVSQESGQQSTEQWIADWVELAKRYRGNPRVIATDLRNEVRTAPLGPTWLPLSPTWGSGLNTDWRLASRQAADQILAVNPELLVVVEAIDWWGTYPELDGERPSLKPMRDWPSALKMPQRLVYAVHNYAFVGPKRAGHQTPSQQYPLYRDMDRETLFRIFDEEWLMPQNGLEVFSAPTWVSEFGVDAFTNDTKDRQWFANLVSYLVQHKMDFAYWPLNPEKSDGPDNYGLLTSDWSSIREDWRTPYLQQLLLGAEEEWPGSVPSYQIADYGLGEDNQSMTLGSWTSGASAATCPDGQRVVGVSRKGFASGRFRVLCSDVGFGDLWSVEKSTSTSEGAERAEYQCPRDHYVMGVSRSWLGTQGVLCAKAKRPLGSQCQTLEIEHGDKRLSQDGGDWARGAHKGQCAKDQYLAGISHKLGSVTSLLCCH